MQKRRVRTQDETKHEAILKAATRLFLKNGYSSTSMEAVAAAARVTKQTVYAHYKSKDALFTHMVMALSTRHTPHDTLLKNAGQPVETLLYEIGLSFLNMITSKEGLAATRLVIAEVQHHPSLAQLYYENGSKRMLALLVQVLDGQNKRKILSIPDTVSAASYFFSMLKGRYYVRMLLAVKPIPAAQEKEEHVREVVRIFMKIYGGVKPLHTKNTL